MIYLLIIVLILFCVSKYDYKKLIDYRIFWFLCLFLTFLSGFRFYLGADTMNYRDAFYNSPILQAISKSFLESSRFQPGWLYFQSFIKTYFEKFVFLQLIQSAFVNFTVFFFIKKYSPLPYLTVLFFFMMNYFEFDMEIMRESIAVSLGLWAFYTYEHLGKRILPLILVFAAFQFHISALVLLSYPLLKLVGFGEKSFGISLIVCLLLPTLFTAIPNLDIYATMLFGQQDDWMKDQYLIQSFNDSLNIFYYIKHTIAYVVIPYIIVYIIKDSYTIKITGFIYAFSYFQYLGMFSYAFYRFANYFVPFFWIGIAIGIMVIIKRYFKSLILPLLVIILILTYTYRNVLLEYESDEHRYMYERYYPYKTVFFENEPY